MMSDLLSELGADSDYSERNVRLLLSLESTLLTCSVNMSLFLVPRTQSNVCSPSEDLRQDAHSAK